MPAAWHFPLAGMPLTSGSVSSSVSSAARIDASTASDCETSDTSFPMTNIPWHKLTPAKPCRKIRSVRVKIWTFQGQTAARMQQIADASVAKSLRIIYHVSHRRCWHAAAQPPSSGRISRPARSTQSPRFCPWVGTRADETKRSKGPDPAAVGRVGSHASNRSGRAHRKGFAAVLLRTARMRLTIAGFPGEGAGQMADHSRLAIERTAIVRPLDIAGAQGPADAQAATATSQSAAERCGER